MNYQPNQSIVDYNDWLPEGNWVDLGYDNAPTEDQLRSQIEAGEHNDAYGDLGCPDCGNVDLFWKTHSSKGQRYRCLSCEYSSNWETVKSQGDLTLQKFGLTVDCPLCSETISAYNRASIDSHFRKHKKEEAEAAEAAEASEPKVSESEWQEEVEWNDKPKKKTEPEWEDVEWEAEAPEQPRKCCECSTTEGLTTIQAGTFCWDCLPINLGAESSQEIKEYITSIHDGDFLWRDGWDNLEFTLQTLPMEIFEEYKDTDNVDGAWEDSPVNSHRLEDTLSQFRWEGDRYPPVVLELDKNGYYDIIDGYHRLNALQILDYDTVEAWVGIPASTFEAEDDYWAGSVAKAIVNEMGDDYYFNEDLHEYNCVHFAQEMSEYLTQDGIPHEIQSFAGYGGEVAHAWVYVPSEGEYYDAWTPYGVSDWKDLDFWETVDYTPEWLEQQTPESFEADVHLLPDAPMAGWYDPRDDSVNINLANKGIRNEALEDNYSGLFDTIAHEYGHKVTSHETRSPYHSEFAAFMVQTNGDFARSKLLAVIHPMCFQEIIMKLPHSNGMISDETLDDFFSTLDFENNLDIIVQAKRFVTYPTIPEWHKEWLKHLISYVETGTAANVTFDAEESGSPTSTQLLNWITQPKTITTAPDGKATEKPKNFDWESEPTRCVWCSSADINSMTPEHQEEGLIYSHVGCNDCSCIWREEYRYVENEIIQAGEKRTLKSEDEQLSIEIEDIDETYGLIPSDPEMLSWAESAVSQYLSRTDLPETFQLHTNPHFVFVSADAFGRSSHLARFRSHTSSHIPIIMLCSEAIRQSADDYGVSLKTAVETTVWHELGHVLCELWWDVEGIYPFESSNDEEEFAESIAKSMFFQESFQNPVV